MGSLPRCMRHQLFAPQSLLLISLTVRKRLRFLKLYKNVPTLRDKDVHLQLSDIPTGMLGDRLLAQEAFKAGIYDEFRPTPEEWLHDQVLSRVALKHGLIECTCRKPTLLTDQDVFD